MGRPPIYSNTKKCYEALTMLDTSPTNIASEITEAIRFRERHMSGISLINQRMMSVRYRDDYSGPKGAENLIFAYVSFMLPELCYALPATRQETDRPVAYKTIAQFLETAQNSWIRRSNFAEVHLQITIDELQGFGVGMVGLEPIQQPESMNDFEGGALVPYFCHVPNTQFFMDGKCGHWRESRFVGHEYFRDLDWIQDNAKAKGFDPKVADRVQASADSYSLSSAASSLNSLAPAPTPYRKLVRLVDLWLKETNELFTIVMSNGREATSQILRQEKYYGPPTGPYQVFGSYLVPGDPYPISRLQADFESFEEYNAHIRVISESAKTYKQGVLVDAVEKQVRAAIISADNNAVTAVPGLDPRKIFQYQLGGPHPEQIAYANTCRQRFDRSMGQSDSTRGNPVGETATAAQIAQSNVDGSVAWVKRMNYKSTESILEKVKWYMFHEPSIVFNTYRQDPITSKVEEGLYVGGVQPGQEDVDPSNFQTVIVDESMGLTDNQVVQARAIQLIELSPQLLQLKMQAQGLNVDYMTDMLGEAMNIKNLSRVLFNQPVIAQMLQQRAMMAQQAAQQQPGMPGAQPGGMPGGPSAGNPGMFNPGLGQPIGQGPPSPINPVFPTAKSGIARPVKPRSNGPAAGPGISPLPKFGLPKTASVGH